MDFSFVLIALCAVVIFGGQYLIGRHLPAWVGAILPIAWVGVIVWIAAHGQMSSWKDYLFAALGFFLLLVFLGGGQQARAKSSGAPNRE